MGLNSTLTYLTLTYTPPDGSPVLSITVRDFEWGNEDETDPNQEIIRSLGGMLYVYNRGPRIRRFRVKFENLSADERALFDQFFSATFVNVSDQWFLLTRTASEKEVIGCGMTVSGAVICPSASNPYGCGQYVLPATVSWYVRVTNPPIVFRETIDTRFSLDLSFEVLNFLPSNASE